MNTKLVTSLFALLSVLTLQAQQYEPIHLAPNMATPITLHNFTSAPQLTTAQPSITISEPKLIDSQKGTWSAEIKSNAATSTPVDLTVKDVDKNTTYNFEKAITVVKDTSGIKELNHTEEHHGADTLSFDKHEGANSNIGSIGFNKGDNKPPTNVTTGIVKPIVGLYIAMFILVMGLLIALIAILKKAETATKVALVSVAIALITPSVGYIYAHI